MQNPNMCDYEYKKTCKIDKNLDIKNCLFKKCLLGELILAFENEITKTNET